MKYLFTLLILSFTLNLKAQAIPEKPEDISPILVGEILPNLPLYDSKNQAKNLKDLITQPTVIVFYRGGWCPYCNVHLSEMVKIEDEITKMGYKILAVSPDDFQNLEATDEQHKMKYELYSDKGAQLIKALGIGFKANDKTRAYIGTKNKGTVTEVMPVPTVLIVNALGEVKMEYIRPDITQRLSGKLLLSILQGLS